MRLLSRTFHHLACALLLCTMVRGSSGQLRLQKGRRAGGRARPRSAVGDDTCQTAASKPGSCVPLIRCRRYWGRGNIPDLSNSACGEETSPRVCCPLVEDDETTTTNANATTENVDTSSAVASTTNSPTTISEESNLNKGRRGAKGIFPEHCGQSGATFSRIIGGQESILGAWPWMAVIYIVRRGSRSAECGGAMITSSHVLTAAHCIVTTRRGNTINPRQLLVRFGELNLDSDNDGAHPVDVKIRTIIKHDGFNLRTFQNDIAILELMEPVEINDFISPICLPFTTFINEELQDRNAVVIGWGSTRFGGPGSAILQEVQLRIWRNNRCRNVFRRDVPITNVNLCAGDGDKDACRGDSGGPLMLTDSTGKFYLIGIVSFGKKCAEPGIPGVYTRVTEFIDWIEEKIG